MSEFGTFTKAGWVQEAGNPSEAVSFEYNGWTRLPDEQVEAIAAAFGPHPPPLGGDGSGIPEWVAYAESLDVDLSALGDDPKRGDVVEAVRNAGHPVGDEDQ